ncbi:polysaccharide biosynthesis protein [Mucilaginibacter paludis]|uniref:Polysaccharide biosynthesis protein CapD n=1 Tax=Mucilaginibacter paludis DSM 18603 TaxID=714943 RepID=H1YJ24_9SPHI|nr:nucleoside-diphosphate sugar epimerase/dehydratase [Mucilaginibacter paludis]EHQ27719.1 polysaccharide biosynthesis protein CapD [Mucilaginibacter paludis DSM 18603]
MFTKINIVPRWVIVLLDLGVCSISLAFANLIQYNFHLEKLNLGLLKQDLLIFLLINCFVFAAFKTYAGIVRYTGIQDGFRISLSVTVSNLILFFAGYFMVKNSVVSHIPVIILIINALMCFLSLMTYRIMVKYIFMYFKNLKLDKRKVIIYGANETGVTTKRTLDHEADLNMTIVAFVDDDMRKCGKIVDNVKIYNVKEIERLIASLNISDVIIAKTEINIEQKNTLVDVCLAHNVHVLNVPPVTDWVNGQFQAKNIKSIKIEDVLERDPIHISNDLIGDQLKGETILVTGAAGSIGSELVRQLIKFNPGLLVLNDLAETPLHNLQLELEEKFPGCKFVPFIGDVRNMERMSLLFETYKPEYVYHAAAYKHVPMMENNPCEAINTNVLGTKTVADLSVIHGVKKFVMISTDKAVNPTNVMGASKRIAEIYVQSLFNSSSIENKLYKNPRSLLKNHYTKVQTGFITTRFGNVLGSNGSVIPRFKAQIEKGGPITVTHPDITRYFMTIPEACRLVLEAGSMGNGGEIFIFDMGKSVKIVDLAKKMIKLSGFVVDKDIKITYSGLRPGEKLYEELLNDAENTMPTHHEKIMVAKTREYSFNTVNENINQLLGFSQSFNDILVVKKMKQIVPEFKSNNSVYEEYDVEEIEVKEIVTN